MAKPFNLNIQPEKAKSLDDLESVVSDDMELDIPRMSSGAKSLSQNSAYSGGLTNSPSSGGDSQVMSTCPCGHLHGPNQGNHHDIYAVGLSSEPLLRGPD